MEQHERFATACLAFALQHDLDFREDFLKTICDYKGQTKAQKFEIALEIKNYLDKKRWDLALSVGEEAVFVVEAKINAPLDPVQDPADREFFASGYGGGIIGSHPTSRTRSYIVLWQEEKSVANRWPDKLRCVAKHWKLLDKFRRSSLKDDLVESLGSFQVHCFAIFNPMTDKLKLAKDAMGACMVHAVLADVASYLKQYIRLPHVTDSSSLDGSYIGWDVIRKGADPNWISFIAPKVGRPKDEISWFGYDGDGKLNVGFYCEPSKTKDVRRVLKKCAAESENVCTDKNYVWIESDGSVAEGDKEWFRNIYDRLSDHIKSGR